ncbi:MAG: hypothetical protein HYR66_14490 [Sphingobacteriales bacterium]|nr:hypothetical protein [Sphingobacteriales bacterium]MBI3720207.1 hypothetical protein [Sphingobacteriales bacterium]
MKIDSTNKAELEKLYKRWYLFYQYMIEIYGNKNLLSKSKELIDLAYNNNKLSQLKAANRDIDIMIREMPYKDASNLLKLFQKELNENYDLIHKKYQLKIQKILQKGKINTPQEYEMVAGWVEYYHADESKKKEVEDLNKILISFHQRILK